MTIEDDLDSLYALRPEEFTARRNELAAAARKRGDAEAAKAIAAARRPTAAAWVVNRLALTDETVRPRVAELHDALRSAHQAMDGQRIRELSAVQRRLVQDLARAGFAAAGVQDPAAAVRDDVTGTLQAAIADPEIAARLGRLSRPEEWSGFGEFGATSAVVTRARSNAGAATRTSPPTSKKTLSQPDPGAIEQARRLRDTASSEVDAARDALEGALATMSEHRAQVTTARRRYEKLLETLAAAERDVDAAATQLDDTERAVRALQRRMQTAEAALKQADSRLGRLCDG